MATATAADISRRGSRTIPVAPRIWLVSTSIQPKLRAAAIMAALALF
jgi:hypothetical protein